MKTSEHGVARIREREGCKLHAYKDSVGIWTVGVGHTSAAGEPKVHSGLKITNDQATEILTRDLLQFEDAVMSSIKVSVNQNEFDAMVSLAFNIGGHAFKGSSVVKRLNKNDRQGAADAFLMWNKAGGKVLKGLTTRREQERAQFLKPVSKET